MSFTVKSIFPQLALNEEETRQHRLIVGRNIYHSWMARFGYPPPKIGEDSFEVCCYPDEFKTKAVALIGRYIKKYNLPAKAKRKRIGATASQRILAAYCH